MILALFCLTLISTSGFANDPNFLDFKPSHSRVTFEGHFVAPNEVHPGDLTET